MVAVERVLLKGPFAAQIVLGYKYEGVLATDRADFPPFSNSLGGIPAKISGHGCHNVQSANKCRVPDRVNYKLVSCKSGCSRFQVGDPVLACLKRWHVMHMLSVLWLQDNQPFEKHLSPEEAKAKAEELVRKAREKREREERELEVLREKEVRRRQLWGRRSQDVPTWVLGISWSY